MATTMKAFSAPVRNMRAARPVSARAADRPMWIPGMTPPTHLNGSMPGDFGFDPLGLGTQGDERLKWCATVSPFQQGKGVLNGFFLRVYPSWLQFSRAGRVLQARQPVHAAARGSPLLALLWQRSRCLWSPLDVLKCGVLLRAVWLAVSHKSLEIGRCLPGV